VFGRQQDSNAYETHEPKHNGRKEAPGDSLQFPTKKMGGISARIALYQ